MRRKEYQVTENEALTILPQKIKIAITVPSILWKLKHKTVLWALDLQLPAHELMDRRLNDLFTPLRCLPLMLPSMFRETSHRTPHKRTKIADKIVTTIYTSSTSSFTTLSRARLR